MLLYLSDGYLLAMAVWLVAGAMAMWWLLKARRRWKTLPRRLLILKLGLSLWMFLASLTVIELYFAVFYDSTDSFNMTNVSKKWFEKHVRPQQKVLAFRSGEGTVYRDDRPFPEVLESGQHHVCFVGDSFAFGQGIPNVADRFSNRVRAKLETTHPGKYVVSNLADTGRDLFWVEALLESVFETDYTVHTVVYVACLNDIETFHKRHRTYYVDLGRHGADFFLFRDTYFLNLMYFRVKLFAVPDVREYYTFVKQYYAGEPWLLMRHKLDRVNRLCRQNGADFQVVVFPFLHNLGPDYPFRHAHEQFVDYCREADIPVLDLDPVLSGHVQDGLTVNPFDAHPNEKAHRLAAEAIERTLLADLFVPPRDQTSDSSPDDASGSP